MIIMFIHLNNFDKNVLFVAIVILLVLLEMYQKILYGSILKVKVKKTGLHPRH